MRNLLPVLGTLCLALAASADEPAPLAAPTFHHVHLNSAAPQEAIAEYLLALPGNTSARLAGFDGFKTTNGVYFLFSPIGETPRAPLPDRVTPDNPQTAFWHFVFVEGDLRATLQRFHETITGFDLRILPLYTGPGGGTVEMSGDTLPGFLTAAEIAAAREQGVEPPGEGGYLNWAGPDGAILEHAQIPGGDGLMIFGMFQEQPMCAVAWYLEHLNAPPPVGATGEPISAPDPSDCIVARGSEPSYPSTYRRGHIRVPPATGVSFGDVLLRWYMNQEDVPLAPMRGTVVDHFALAVGDLDAWIAKLQKEGVTFLEGPKPYLLGDTRAVMIEGPSLEAIELVALRQNATAELSADARTVLALDRAAEDALNRMDTELLSTIYADDLVFTHGETWTNSDSIGFTTSKAEWLDFIADSDGMFTEKNANTQRIEMHADVALVQGRSSGRNMGEAYEIWYLRVYAKRDRRWQLISHKTVRGPQPPSDIN